MTENAADPAPVTPSLPSAFHRLWAAVGINSLGDGIYVAALPLLGSSLTTDPVALSLVTASALLPWVIFGLLGGALVDRWDRRRTMWMADVFRALVLGFGVAALALGFASIALLISVAFLLGMGQILFDTASQSYIPQLIGRDQSLLQRASGRLQGVRTVADGMAGPPMGAALFAFGRSIPFAADAVSFLSSALLIRSLPADVATQRVRRGTLWSEIKVGASYLVNHRLLLGLALRPAVGNIAFMAGEAILVLFARDRLALSNSGFGLLLASQAVGGLAGAALAGRLAERVGTGTALVVTAAIEAGAMLVLGFSISPYSAACALAAIGAGMTGTMVIGPAVRQAIVPAELMGRVSAASRLLAVAGGPLGAIAGGLLASHFGLRAPFVFGAVLLAGMTLLTASMTSNRKIDAALAEARTIDQP